MNGRIRLLTLFVLCFLVMFSSSCGKLQRSTTEIASERDLDIRDGSQRADVMACEQGNLADWHHVFQNLGLLENIHDIKSHRIGKEEYSIRGTGDVVGSLRCAAENDDAKAQFLLAKLYHWGGMTINGTHVPMDLAKAEEWRRRAAANDPCLALADWRGFSGLLERNLPFFTSSAFGRGSVINMGGDCDIKGGAFVGDDMVRPYEFNCHNKDIVEALRCAADLQDDPEAQYYLAAIYADGVIINDTRVQKDVARAKELLERAAANDFCRAKVYLARSDPLEALNILKRCASSEGSSSPDR